MKVETVGELNLELFAKEFIRIVRREERRMERESKLNSLESKKTTPKTKSSSNNKE
ncbi:hypothetical protein ILT06_02125 [Bacillus sp. 17RED48]|uniref:hypothetical protein n=1 Tax=Bacillus TaxID=1386 RepID=UPI001C9AEA6C|nr:MULTISPECIES: hypothetical protein [Bacillus]MBY7109715.1 hypothetical protein [Bacillus sp. 17RED48]MED3615334.1 hypothetical protein [Bacillus wiedmannii]